MTAALAPPPLATPAPVAHGRAPHLRVVSSPPAAGDVGARTDRLADGLAARFGTAPQAFWPVPGAVSLPGTQGLVCGAGLFLPVGRQALVAVRRDQDDRIEFSTTSTSRAGRGSPPSQPSGARCDWHSATSAGHRHAPRGRSPSWWSDPLARPQQSPPPPGRTPSGR